MNPLNISLLYLLSSLVVGCWGRNRRFGFWGYFFASVLLTPAIGVLLVIASTIRPEDGLDS